MSGGAHQAHNAVPTHSSSDIVALEVVQLLDGSWLIGGEWNKRIGQPGDVLSWAGLSERRASPCPHFITPCAPQSRIQLHFSSLPRLASQVERCRSHCFAARPFTLAAAMAPLNKAHPSQFFNPTSHPTVVSARGGLGPRRRLPRAAAADTACCIVASSAHGIAAVNISSWFKGVPWVAPWPS